MENKHLENTLRVTLATLVAAAGGCSQLKVVRETSHVTKDDGLYRIVKDVTYNKRDQNRIISERIIDDYLICQMAREPITLSADDPVSSEINMEEEERYDMERSYYGECVEKAAGTDLPDRKKVVEFDKDKTLGRLDIFLDNREDKTQVEKSLAHSNEVIGKLADAAGKKPKVIVENKPVYSPTNENKIGDVSGGSVDAGYIKDFNRGKQEEVGYDSNVNLTLEEQYAICQETEEGKALAEYVGEVAFKDCKHAPQEAENNSMKNLVDKLTKSIKQGDLIIYCGMTTEPSADQCPPYTDKGNLGLAWDRAHDTGRYCESKLPGTTSLGFALGINGKRAARAYKLRRGG